MRPTGCIPDWYTDQFPVIAQQSPPISRFRHLELLVLLGMLQAFAPLSIDMYLPAMPADGESVPHFGRRRAVHHGHVPGGIRAGPGLYGPITDRFGRKPPLYASLALFIVSSAACALAPSIRIMSFFRLLQAIGACGGSVISRAIVRDLFPPSELRRIFSMLVLVVGVSPVIAPMFGSYLLIWFGWQAAFVTQTLIGIACLAGMHFRLSESLPHSARIPLRVDTMASAYSRLIKDRTFLGASVVCGFSSAGAFAYITSAPFVLHQSVQGSAGGVRLAVRSGRGRHGRGLADQRPDVASDADLARAAELRIWSSWPRACCCWSRCDRTWAAWLPFSLACLFMSPRRDSCFRTARPSP